MLLSLLSLLPLGEPLVLVPLLSVPMLKLAVHTTWKLPGGRSQLDHHLYPAVTRGEAVAAAGGGATAGGSGGADGGNQVLQERIDPASFVRAEGLVLGLDFALSSGVSWGQWLEGKPVAGPGP